MTEDQRDVLTLIKTISDKNRFEGDQTFEKFGLTVAQVHYLAYIDGQGGEVPLKEIERHFNVSHPTVTGIIRRLADKGFATISVDETDRRNRIVHTTQKSWQIKEELDAHYSEMLKRAFVGIDDKDVAWMKSLLEQINQNLSEMGKGETI